MKKEYINYLKEIILKCGIEHDSFGFIQLLPTNIVIDNFNDLFAKGNISTFNTFQDIITKIQNDPEEFLNFLKPVKSSYDIYLFSSPKSLCQIFLMISEISNFLIDILIEKVCELSQTNDMSDNDLAILCLNQFKWNIYNKNMNEIINRLLDLGYVSNNKVQNHLIRIFPDICQGKCNKILAEKIFDWMSSNNNLIACSLATINKLDLPEGYVKDVEQRVTEMLDSATMNTLPYIITFLVKCTKKANQITLIDKIRLNVEFDNLQSMFSGAISSTPIDNEHYDISSAVQLINSLKINLQFSPTLRKSWLKSISCKLDQVRSENFDFIILLIIFHEYKNESSAVVSLIKSKISKRLFTNKMIETLFKYHLALLHPLYKSFFTILNMMPISNDGVFLSFVKSAYLQSYLNPFKDLNEQYIFDCLIMDISVKSKNYVDGVLEILKYLAERCRHKIKLFYLKICDLMTNNHNLNCNQVYSIYCVLGLLGFQPSEDQEDLNDTCGQIKNDIVLLIRKQLQNPDFIIRRNGGIGAVTVMRYLSKRDNASDSVNIVTNMIANPPDSESEIISNNSEDGDISTSQRIVTTILKLLLSYANTIPELVIVIFDELYKLISQDEMLSVEQEIGKIIANSFKDDFICNISEITNNEPLLGLVGMDHCDVSIVVSQIKSHLGVEKKKTNINLPAHFRLLALYELRNKNNLIEINALLGCSVIINNKFEQCTPLEMLTLINLFIEIVNAFSYDVNVSGITNFRLTMMKRMKLIVTLMSKLENLLRSQSKPVKLPTVNVTNGSHLLSVSEIKKTAVKRKIGKGKAIGKKNQLQSIEKDTSQHSGEESEELFQLDKNEDAEISGQCKILPDALNFCYHELDISVYIMLSDLANANFVLSENSEESLGWEEVHYYLYDLLLKIKHCLPDKFGFPEGFSFSAIRQKNWMLFRYLDQLKEEDIVEKVISVAPLFRFILTKCTEICNKNDVPTNDLDPLPCLRVMETLLKILTKIFRFLKNYSKDTDMKMLLRFSCNLSSGSTSFVNQLLNLADTIPNVSIAASYCELVYELSTISEIELVDICLIKLTAKFLGVTWSSQNLINYKCAISKIFEIHLSALSDQWFEVLSDEIIPELHTLVNCDQNIENRKYTCFNKNSILCVFKQIFDFVLKKCKTLSKVKNSERNTVDILMSWDKLISVIKLCTKIIADSNDLHITFSFIKFSKDFIKFIIKSLMPIFDNLFRHENDIVIQLLTGIQSVTRFVQRLCTHCKNKKNLPSASLVPQLRQYLETFMFRVKKMMCVNKCSVDSINILLLANKDLHGQRIEDSCNMENQDEANNDIENDAFSEDLENESLSLSDE